MKTIVLVSNNRPDYLRGMLGSLRDNDCTGWGVVAYLEPPGEECKALIKSSFPRAEIITNAYRMGLPLNALQAWHTTFKKGAEAVLYLEEDIILAKDALRVVDWCLGVEKTRPNCMGVTLYNDSSHPGREDQVARVRRFRAFAMATTARRWLNDWQRNFLVDERGWDFGINGMLGARGEGFMLAPVAARANHTGRSGQHCLPEYHDRWFSWVKLSQVRPERYRLKEGPVENRDYLQPDPENPFHDGV